MERRRFLKGLGAMALCPLCVGPAIAADGHHWSYEGATGPDHWGASEEANLACSAGSQQSPIDISAPVSAQIPPLSVGWKKGAGKMVNNGHTIQVNMSAGSGLTRAERSYELLQFHFHAPSEHRVEGKTFPMEVHFVHKAPDGKNLGVLGIFFVPGNPNPAFAALAAAFPAKEGDEVAVDVDPAGFLPATLGYYAYQGSLTTPPCSEVVDWMVAKESIAVAPTDIGKFTALYAMNARPILPSNRRFILSSA